MAGGLLKKVENELRAANLSSLLREAQDRRERDGDPLWLYVLGPGNAGKSSLINALAGALIAPVGVVPVTWKIDIYRRATGEERATLRHADGRQNDVSLERGREICQRLEEKGKAARREGRNIVSNLAEVTWWVDAPGLPEHIALVDTPGLAQMRSVDAKDAGGLGVSVRTRERALTLLHRADVLVWLMRANKLQSTQHDALEEALKEQGATARRVIGVLSRWDAVGEDRRAEALSIAETRFGTLVPEFIPAVLRAGKPGHDDCVKQLRASLFPAQGEWSSLKAAADEAFAQEQALRGARAAAALSLAQSRGAITVTKKEREASSWLSARMTELRHALERQAANAAKAARGRCGAAARGFEEWDPRKATTVFHTRVLDVDLLDAELRDALDAELPEVARGLSDLGMRVELPVVREVDRQGRATTSVYSLGAFDIPSPEWARDHSGWRNRVTSAKGIFDGLADVFRKPQDKARLRFERGIDAWKDARKEDIAAVVEGARAQLAGAFEGRLASAHRAAYGRPLSAAPGFVLRFGKHARVLEHVAGEDCGSAEGLRAMYAFRPEDVVAAQRSVARALLTRVHSASSTVVPAADELAVPTVPASSRSAGLPRQEEPLQEALQDRFSALCAPLTPVSERLREIEREAGSAAAVAAHSALRAQSDHVWGPASGWLEPQTLPELSGERISRAVSPPVSFQYSGRRAGSLLKKWHESKEGAGCGVFGFAAVFATFSACGGFAPGVLLALFGGVVVYIMNNEQTFQAQVAGPADEELQRSLSRASEALRERRRTLPKRLNDAVVEEACRVLNSHVGLPLFKKDS